jgi:hypothetical protein
MLTSNIHNSRKTEYEQKNASLVALHLSYCICWENSRKWRRKKEKRERERNYHKLNAIKWIYILFAYITGRADTSSCSSLNYEETRACYVHGARKRKKRILEMVANEIKLEFEYMHSLLISLPRDWYTKTYDTI